jgi:hypothetical protein
LAVKAKLDKPVASVDAVGGHSDIDDRGNGSSSISLRARATTR